MRLVSQQPVLVFSDSLFFSHSVCDMIIYCNTLILDFVSVLTYLDKKNSKTASNIYESNSLCPLHKKSHLENWILDGLVSKTWFY